MGRSRRETLYAQRELSMTGFTGVSDMTWSIVSAGRKRIIVRIVEAVAAVWKFDALDGGGPSGRYVLGVKDIPPPPARAPVSFKL